MQDGGDIPPGQYPPPSSVGHSGRPPSRGAAVSRSSSITNITSASLANLAKGVEHNISQMQQSMMEGGPFRDLQQQPGGPTPNASSGQGPPTSQSHSTQNGGAPNTSQPSVNNTFVNAHMSIGQVNIQNVNASQQQHGNFDANGHPTGMQQDVNVTMNTANMGARFPDDPNFTGPRTSSTGKAVKPNTIQYHPPQALPSNESIVPPKQGFDYMPERFPSPLTNLENKTPSSKISYYPDNNRLPPPPPQRLPMSVNGPMAVSSHCK